MVLQGNIGQCGLKPNTLIFKKMTQNIGNFINLPYTLAIRNQKLQCYYRLDGSDYDSDNMDIGPGNSNPKPHLLRL